MTDRPSPRPLARLRGIRTLVRRLDPYLGGSRRAMVLVVVISLMTGFGEAVLLLLVVRAALDLAGQSQDLDSSPIDAFVQTPGTTLLLAAAIAFLLLVTHIVLAKTTARIATDAQIRGRTALMRSFLDASWDQQAIGRSGEMQELLSVHTMRVSNGVMALVTGLTAVLTFAAYIASALVVSSLITVAVLTGLVAVSGMLIPINRLTRKRSSRTAQANASYSMEATQGVAMAKETRVFDASDEVHRLLADHAYRAGHHGYLTRWINRFASRAYQMTVLLLLIAGLAAVHLSGTTDVAALGTVVVLLVRSLTYSQQIATSAQLLAETSPYVAELERAKDLYRRHAVRREGRHLDTVRNLRLENITFAYQRDVPVLNDVSCSVAGGQTIGIVGPSGSGKSTLVQLLLRLRSPDRGSYLVNGESAEGYELRSWCQRFTFVPQDNHLIRSSVRDNIRFYRPQLTDREIEVAARLAHIHDEIEALPQGYETILGSGAMDLSGGQRQRIGFARALVTQPGVLILDEPTSALDMRSETLIQRTLAKLQGSITLFIVAHRMSTLSICDRILVLEAGRITAFGTPSEVQASNRFYAEALQPSNAAG